MSSVDGRGRVGPGTGKIVLPRQGPEWERAGGVTCPDCLLPEPSMNRQAGMALRINRKLKVGGEAGGSGSYTNCFKSLTRW